MESPSFPPTELGVRIGRLTRVFNAFRRPLADVKGIALERTARFPVDVLAAACLVLEDSGDAGDNLVGSIVELCVIGMRARAADNPPQITANGEVVPMPDEIRADLRALKAETDAQRYGTAEAKREWDEQMAALRLRKPLPKGWSGLSGRALHDAKAEFLKRLRTA